MHKMLIKQSYITLIFAIVALLFSCDSIPDEESDTPPVANEPAEPVIVALGDSLTAGLGVGLEKSYPALLQEKLEGAGYAFRVVNAGVSGETSSGTLSRLDWILSQGPEVVILEIGANDGLRGIDTTLVENNIGKIIQRLQENGIVTVLAGMKMVRNLGDTYSDKFDAIFPRLADKYDVIFMPFFLKDIASESALNQGDGIHPNEQGYRIITENIYPYVVQAIKKLEKRDSQKE